jgi:hypothetical protein
MDPPRRRTKSVDGIHNDDGDLETGARGQRTGKGNPHRMDEDNASRETEDVIKEWHLDDLLSFDKSQIVQVHGLPSELPRNSSSQSTPPPPWKEPTERSHGSQRLTSSEKLECALIILNQAIDVDVEIFINLFTRCTPIYNCRTDI